MPLLELDTEETDGRARVVLRGELDISSAPVLEEALGRVEEAAPAVLVIDLRGLAFMDSTGLRTVVSADQRARDQGRRLVIVRGPEPVDRIFSVTRLDERLKLVDDPAAA
ncbi:MAG: anti-sigma factor antagonist [Solirubrobacteraceae bacterium]|jgi:anti-anti-sigma factor|nr:anti-sigma factor antagonist [Solirubrobacteraceae bacterium]